MYKRQGYAWTDKLRDTSTATVTAKLNGWFVEYGYPEYIRTDGGPQFRRDFKAYCDKHYIIHELSSPYNPESNGLAEAAVKNMKSLILRCADRKEKLSTAILHGQGRWSQPSTAILQSENETAPTFTASLSRERGN